MAENILVYKFDELKDCSARINSVAESVENVESISKTIFTKISAEWEGEAYNAFVERYNDMMGAVKMLHEQIDKNRQKLDKAIEMMSQNEQNIQSNVVGVLDADNIF